MQKESNNVEKLIKALVGFSVLTLLVLIIMEVWECDTDLVMRVSASSWTITFFAFMFALMAGKMSDPNE